ncbi:2OG-Fe(II) oxygenase [Streptomyces meridianus]|uniref:2OG-Fe(II) oxygenase n=1 Tax=Streptomyces meridianus TaxID=2938945 RepID=A0ABT0XAR9_9ACTN|nr:2OG-Fe(II) oxygenase [Streptomyces meridianus]MCM2579606.1 2OG-Fe(II) oxygenase [Streptomyces meridianus]
MAIDLSGNKRKGALELPKTATGFDQVFHAVRARKPRYDGKLPTEPRWRSDFVLQDIKPPTLKLQDFGYEAGELNRGYGTIDETALAGPTQLLTPEGVVSLKGVCDKLEAYAGSSEFIVTRRVRGADLMSPFINNMIRDRNFLLACSRMVGVPLIPHPLRTPTVQINYFEGRSGDEREIAKWHRDGMDYVFTIQLNDASEYEGGRFKYFQGRTDDFDGVTESDERIKEAPCDDLGATLFIHGSHMYHAVTPVTSGRRVTFVLSLFCPYFSSQDSNTFWHLAGDDGILATIPNWLRLKWPTKNPSIDFSLRAGSPAITWSDLQ